MIFLQAAKNSTICIHTDVGKKLHSVAFAFAIVQVLTLRMFLEELVDGSLEQLFANLGRKVIQGVLPRQLARSSFGSHFALIALTVCLIGKKISVAQ
jgi:hypothetical protein